MPVNFHFLSELTQGRCGCSAFFFRILLGFLFLFLSDLLMNDIKLAVKLFVQCIAEVSIVSQNGVLSRLDLFFGLIEFAFIDVDARFR